MGRDATAADLVERALALLAHQRSALVQGEVATLAQCAEALADTLAHLRRALVRDAAPPAGVGQLQQQLRLNRVLLANGLTVADHFFASLAPPSGPASVLLWEQV